MTLSGILTLLLFVGGFMLLGRLLKWAASRARAQEALERAQLPAPSQEEGSQAEAWQAGAGREPTRTDANALATRPFEGGAPGFDWRRASTPAGALFRTRQELRHAVIVMTVLGPCLALEAHDRARGGSGSRAAVAEGPPGTEGRA